MYGARQRYVGGLGVDGRFTCYIRCAFKFPRLPRNPFCTRIEYYIAPWPVNVFTFTVSTKMSGYK